MKIFLQIKEVPSMDPETLAHALKNGGFARVAVDGVEECDEQICAGLRGVCAHVGTCWTEAK